MSSARGLKCPVLLHRQDTSILMQMTASDPAHPLCTPNPQADCPPCISTIPFPCNHCNSLAAPACRAAGTPNRPPLQQNMPTQPPLTPSTADSWPNFNLHYVTSKSLPQNHPPVIPRPWPTTHPMHPHSTPCNRKSRPPTHMLIDGPPDSTYWSPPPPAPHHPPPMHPIKTQLQPTP